MPDFTQAVSRVEAGDPSATDELLPLAKRLTLDQVQPASVSRDAILLEIDVGLVVWGKSTKPKLNSPRSRRCVERHAFA